MSSLLRVVTVDVTNTLIRVAGSPGKQYAFIAGKHGIFLDENLLNGMFFKYYKHYSKKFPNFGMQNGMPAFRWWECLVKDCFISLDPTLHEEQLNKVSSDLYYHYMTPHAWELLPGAVEAMKDLREYPIKLGVISNWDHRLYKVLLCLGLRDFFDFVLPSYVIGVEKPNHYIFHQALKNAKCKAHEAVHFGDNMEKDFLGAKNAGMNAYLLQTDGKKPDFLDQSLVVSSVQEFVDAIRPRLREKVTADM